MAVTISVVSRGVVGDQRFVDINVTGPASYTSGGEALTAAQLNTVMPEYSGALAATDSDKVTFFQSDRNASGQSLIWDKANDKVLFADFDSDVTAATNLSSVTIKGRAFYKA